MSLITATTITTHLARHRDREARPMEERYNVFLGRWRRKKAERPYGTGG